MNRGFRGGCAVAAVWMILALGGCARQPVTRWSALAVDGYVNSSMSQVRIDIDGETVVQGPLRVQRCRQSHLPGLGGCGPVPLPLTGSYRQQEVRVECEQLPFAGYPYCDVYVDGELAVSLLFDTLAPDGGYVPSRR
mgnify:CR=1 FL=1